MKITIERPYSSHYKQRHFLIKGNGKTLGYIGNGDQKEIEINDESQLQIKIDSFTGGPLIHSGKLRSGTRLLVYSKPYLAIFPLAGLFFLVIILGISYFGISRDWMTSLLIGLLLISYIPFLTIWKNRWLKVEVQEPVGKENVV